MKLLYLIVIVAVIAAGYMTTLDPSEQEALISDISTQVDTVTSELDSTMSEAKEFIDKVGHIEEDLNEHTRKLQELVDSQ